MQATVSNTTNLEQESIKAKKEIWRTLWILSVLTVVELLISIWMMKMESPSMRLFAKGSIVILMLAKAFYIIAYFMHLKHEMKTLVATMILPIIFLIWGIVAFCSDGYSYGVLRSRYDPYYESKSKEKVENKQHSPKEESKSPVLQ